MSQGRDSPDNAELLPRERRRQELHALRDQESRRRRATPRVTSSPTYIPMMDDWTLPSVLVGPSGSSPIGVGTTSPDILAAAMRASNMSPAIGLSSGTSPARSLPNVRRTTTTTTTSSRRTRGGKRPRTRGKRPRRQRPPPPPPSPSSSGSDASPSAPRRPSRSNAEMRRQLEDLQQQELEPADDETIRNITRTSTITTVYDKRRPPHVHRTSTRSGPGRRTRRVTQ